MLLGDPTPVTRAQFHDAAAALVRGPQVVAAVEEERLNRIKHTNRFPENAIRFCLEHRDFTLGDVDKIAVAVDEDTTRRFLNFRNLHGWGLDTAEPRDLYNRCFVRCFGHDVADKLVFVRHHQCHAHSARILAGWDRGLLVTLDGYGDTSAGLVISMEPERDSELLSITANNSLGLFYHDCIRHIGYDLFDEGKVMALAAFGDSTVFREWFRTLYQLNSDGTYTLDPTRAIKGIPGFPRRHKMQPIAQAHRDFAAALQETLETIGLHLLAHFARQTGHRNLVLSGGVALNCAFVGKVLYSGLFEQIYVPPATNDSGIAMGAALAQTTRASVERSHSSTGQIPASTSLSHTVPFWGPAIADGDDLERELAPWSALIDYRRAARIDKEAATLLAEGAIIGWVQGRSAFGPRALGNRSILADPRSVANKHRINQVIKKREAYRPFAPVVTESGFTSFFDLPNTRANLGFMTIAARVHGDASLEATTHVDGTARVQTVTAQQNPPLHALLKAFETLTGVPVLLNTSFNNNVEPIVSSLADALTCYVTSELDYLVAGDYLISKKPVAPHSYLELAVSLPPRYELRQVRSTLPRSHTGTHHEIAGIWDQRVKSPISPTAYQLLLGADGRQSVRHLWQTQPVSMQNPIEDLIAELRTLWAGRFIILAPSGMFVTPLPT